MQTGLGLDFSVPCSGWASLEAHELGITGDGSPEGNLGVVTRKMLASKNSRHLS